MTLGGNWQRGARQISNSDAKYFHRSHYPGLRPAPMNIRIIRTLMKPSPERESEREGEKKREERKKKREMKEAGLGPDFPRGITVEFIFGHFKRHVRVSQLRQSHRN